MSTDYCGECGLIGGGDAVGCTVECTSPKGKRLARERDDREPQFSIYFARGNFSLSEMLESNAGDEETEDFVRAAKLGDSKQFGGGAGPRIIITRVS